MKIKEQCISIEAMQSHMILQPVKSLMYHNFRVIYKVYNLKNKKNFCKAGLKKQGYLSIELVWYVVE